MAGRFVVATAFLLAIVLQHGDSHTCIHEEIQETPISLYLGGQEERVKRNADIGPIRIHTFPIQDRIDSSVPAFVLDSGGAMDRATAFLAGALSVEQVVGTFILKPMTTCTTNTLTAVCTMSGDCTCPMANVQVDDITCGIVTVPSAHIDAAQGCDSDDEDNPQCVDVTTAGSGLTDTDIVVYVSAEQTVRCVSNSATQAYAGSCVVDAGNGRPLAGYVNICPLNILAVTPSEDFLTRVLVHELLHVLAFSNGLFNSFQIDPPADLINNLETYKGTTQRGIGISSVLDRAKSHYDCPDLKSLFLEPSSSHWETRILLPEIMTPILYNAYSVMSTFTLALLESSGWYTANYAVANSTVLGKSIPLLYGKGLGCDFIREDCTDSANFPYTCDTTRNTGVPFCSFDGIYKSVCIAYPSADGCTLPSPIIDFDCSNGTTTLRDADVEVAGSESLCYMTTLSTSGTALAESTSTCLETHPVNTGTSHYYGLSTANDTIISINYLRYTCTSDDEVLTGVSPEVGQISCSGIETILALQADNILQPADYCDSSCGTCQAADDPSSCLTCSDSTFLVNSPPGPCVLPDNSVRLVGGDSSNEGRVEIVKAGQYHTVCVDYWTQAVANVVCRQLGFELLAQDAFLGFGGVFGEGSAPILDDERMCTGSEDFLSHCSSVSVDITSCDHSRDASVRCSDVCSFATYASEGSCVSSCPAGQIADHVLRMCRNPNSSDFASVGFTPSFTKLEAAVIANEDGVLTINTPVKRSTTIVDTLDTEGLILLTILHNDIGANWRTDPSFSNDIIVSSSSSKTVEVGVYNFQVSLSYNSVIGGGTTDSEVYDATIQVFRRASCQEDSCSNGGTCSTIVINEQLTFTCACAPGYTGITCQDEICEPDPCQNGGTCLDMTAGYLCMCPNTWEGTDCEVDVNECERNSNLCENGGTCNNNDGGYSCSCPSTWMGDNCNEDVDECAASPNPCMNEGTCNNFNGTFNCSCTMGWEGTTCEVDINECDRNPNLCENGGTCNNNDGGYSCSCPSTWMGDNCNEDVDECAATSPNPCMNGGACNNFAGTFNCSCTSNWMGDNCEVDVDECEQNLNLCANGGTCNNNDGGYACSCPSNWSGDNCEVDVNECEQNLNLCENGGTCNNFNGTFNCSCPSNWMGDNCEVDVDECDSVPCQNNGTCVNTDGGFNCSCTDMWSGSQCESDVDECSDDPCGVNGACNNTVGDYFCDCMSGWSGQNCEVDIDECEVDDPCVFGNCTNIPGNYICSCVSGWNCKNCDCDVNECSFNTHLCQNGGSCNNFDGGHNCSCTAQWEGSDCEEDVDECLQDPCMDGGTCSNIMGDFDCICQAGFTGPICEVDMRDPCEDNPCGDNGDCVRVSSTHYVCMCDSGYTGSSSCIMVDDCEGMDCGNGTCVDQLNAFMCSCDAGFTGQACDTQINLCDSDPCQNSGTCISGFLSYTCRCLPGYNGTNCENDIDPCSPNPCQNSGDCTAIDSIDFSCDCPPPYTSLICDVEIDYCAGFVCENSGECYVESFAPRCNCTVEYYGDQCQFVDTCGLEPCDNEGTCSNVGNSFNCSCMPEYTGQNCSIAVDPCMADPDPCENGNCSSPSAGEFVCSCDRGYTGMTCDSDIMECLDNPCVNGNCTDIPGSYTCACDPDWTGRHCDVSINPCLPNNPCSNNGTCVDGVGPNTYTCDCAAVDYDGEFCQNRINDCDPNSCLNNGTCVDLLRDYMCMCPSGLQGTNCNEDVLECEADPCVNGICNELFGDFECDCIAGFGGPTCEMDLFHCSEESCLNGGQCVEGVGTATSCNCTAGFVGERCEVQDCTGEPCVNGECMYHNISVGSFTCECDSGYTGFICNEDIDECAIDELRCGTGVCMNIDGSFNCSCPANRGGDFCQIEIDFCAGVDCTDGVCMNQTDSYFCMCNTGYTGMNCETNINDCISVDCNNNGECRDLLGDFECICNQGYNGTLCEIEFTICSDNPCNENRTASCDDNEGRSMHTCTCLPGYRGANCEEDIDHCRTTQCQNGATCVDGILEATCDCVPGYTGADCSSNINECASEPCENGGTCADGVNSYTCDCTFGYSGADCTDYILSGDCARLSPCANGGTCMDTADAYECSCTRRWDGDNCTEMFDDCKPNDPCQNGATCFNQVEGYTCICPPGYTGQDCEQFGGTPTNCTSDSECGSGFFCLRNCPIDGYPDHKAFLNSPLNLQGQSSLFVPKNKYPSYTGGDFTIVARFRQDPSNAGYLLYYSVDSSRHTFGILLNSSDNSLRILHTPLLSSNHSFQTINLGVPINDNAYHTLAVVVNSKNTGYHVETIVDGSYSGGFKNDISIDSSTTDPNPTPVWIVGSRLPLPGLYRFKGRISQVAFFETTLTLQQINTVRIAFNELNGVLGECEQYMEEGLGCPVPQQSSSSLCETTLGRCNPAMRCLPDAQGAFSCRSAPIDCTDGAYLCADSLFADGAVCGGLDFPIYGANFFDRPDTSLPGMIEYLQKDAMVFDYETQPRVIPIAEHPNITSDLTIFALVDQASGNDGYVLAKGINSRTRDYALFLRASGPSVSLSYRASDGTTVNLVFSNVDVSGKGPTTVAVIIDSENGRAELFVNGSSAFKKILRKTPQFMPDDHMLWIGGRPDISAYKFRGTIQNLFVSNVALPYDIIESMSSQALTGNFQSPSVSHYCFERAEEDKYCRMGTATDNPFQCAAGMSCVAVGTPVTQQPEFPYNDLGTLGTCQ